MMSKEIVKIISYVTVLLFCFNYTGYAQIEAVGCYTSDHKIIKPGDSWNEVYNGVSYRCTCNGDGTTSCVPLTSNTSNSYGTGSNNINTQIVEGILQPLFQNLLDWIFSPSESRLGNDSNDQTERESENEKNKKAYEEYRKKVEEQVNKANNEYLTLVKNKFENDKQYTVNVLKDRIAKSDAIKNVKLLNCSAYRSLEISKAVLDEQIDFRNLSSSMENNRTLADFENSKSTDCPEIKINVPEVSMLNPVSFQERFFETVKIKSDSITVKVGLMKQKEKRIKETVALKEKEIEQLKKNERPLEENKKSEEIIKNDNEKLLQEALDALNEALEEEKKVEIELKKSEKDIEQLEKIRSAYDIGTK